MSEKLIELYHSKLVPMGQIWVQVDSNPMKSKYPNKPNYVCLTINGAGYRYNCENPQCEQFFTGRQGQRLFIQAVGSRAEAAIQFLGQPGSQVPQPPPMPPPQNPQPQYQAPPPQAPQYQQPPPVSSKAPEVLSYAEAVSRPPQPPPPPGEMTPQQALDAARKSMHQLLSLFKVAVRGTLEFKRQFDALPPELRQGIKFNDDVFWQRATSFAIALEDKWRLGFPDRMPKNIELATLQMVSKQPAPAQPPTPQPPAPCPKCGTVHGSNECPEDD